MLIIGGENFVASNFLQKTRLDVDIGVFSRLRTSFSNEIVSADLTQISDLHFQWADVVLNCSAIRYSPFKSSSKYYRTNYRTAQDNARKAKRNGVKYFIQLSNLSVYGHHRYIDSSTPTIPVSHYGKSILLADRFIIKLADNAFKVLIVRTPALYGEPGAPNNIINALIYLVNRRIPIFLAKCNNQRQYLHINNLVTFLDEALTKKPEGIRIPIEEETPSTPDLVRLIGQKTGKKIRLFYFPCQNKILRNLLPGLYYKFFSDLLIDPDFGVYIRTKFGVNEGLDKMCNS